MPQYCSCSDNILMIVMGKADRTLLVDLLAATEGRLTSVRDALAFVGDAESHLDADVLNSRQQVLWKDLVTKRLHIKFFRRRKSSCTNRGT